MKLNKIFLAIASVGVLFSSCEQTFTPEPSPEAPANAQVVYFQTPTMTGVEIDPEANVTDYPIVLQRADSTSALTLEILVLQNDNDAYTVPATFSFAAGVGTDTLVVGLNEMQSGVPHTLSLQIDPSLINPYATGAEKAFCQLEITPIKWEKYTNGVFCDGLVSSTFNVPAATWYVDYKIATLPDGSKKLCIIAPYTKLPAGEDVVTDADGIDDAYIYFGNAITPNSYDFMLYISPEGVVTFDELYLGLILNPAYGEASAVLYDGAGVYTEGVSVTFPEGAVVFAMGGELYNYANFTLYMTKEAYLEATAVEGIDAEVSDYEGTFALTAFDFTGTAIEETVHIASTVDEDGQYYTIEGIPTMNPIFGMFNDKSHMMHIPAQNSANIVDEETGAEYEVVIYTLDSEGYTSTDDLVLAYNEDGTISIDESSPVIGIVAVAFSTVDENDYFFVNNGCLGMSLSSIDTPDGVAPKLSQQHKGLNLKQMTPRKKIAIANK